VASDKFSPSPSSSGLGAWLPALFMALLSVSLMAVDARFGIGTVIRAYTSELASPVWWLASRPKALLQGGIDAMNTNAALRERVTRLERERLRSDLALQRLIALQAENAELRVLLKAQTERAPGSRAVELVNVNPEPSLKRLVIGAGRRQNVRVGQVVIDAGGLVGQVSEVYPSSAVVIAITDADHAVPVMVARSGFRAILFGQGNDSRLSLANLTPSDDIKAGDVLLTSGLGGRFPPGIPVGVVKTFRQDPALTFLSAQVQPFARTGYGRHLLLLDPLPARPPATAVQPPAAPVPAAAKPVPAESKP